MRALRTSVLPDVGLPRLRPGASPLSAGAMSLAMEPAEAPACWGWFRSSPRVALGCGCPFVPLPCGELRLCCALLWLEPADPCCLPQLQEG